MLLFIISVLRVISVVIIISISLYLLTYVIDFLCRVVGLQRIADLMFKLRQRINKSISKVLRR